MNIDNELYNFMQKVVQELEKEEILYEKYNMAVDYENKSIKLTDKTNKNNGSLLSVGNLFEMYKQGESIQYIVSTLKSSMFGGMPQEVNFTWDEIKDRIYPQLKPTDSIESVMICKDFCIDSGVSIGYVIDFPDRMMYITEMMMDKWGISIDVIHETSLKNLIRITPSSPKRLGVKQDPIFGYHIEDEYVATRILITNMWKIEQKFKGRACAVIPNRSCIVIFDESSLSRERIHLQAIKDYNSYPYPLSNNIFVYDNGEWKILN